MYSTESKNTEQYNINISTQKRSVTQKLFISTSGMGLKFSCIDFSFLEIRHCLLRNFYYDVIFSNYAVIIYDGIICDSWAWVIPHLYYVNYLASSSLSDSPNVIISWDILWPWRWPLTDFLTFTSHEDIRRKIRLSSCLALTRSWSEVIFCGCSPRWLKTLSGISGRSETFKHVTLRGGWSADPWTWRFSVWFTTFWISIDYHLLVFFSVNYINSVHTEKFYESTILIGSPASQ